MRRVLKRRDRVKLVAVVNGGITGLSFLVAIAALAPRSWPNSHQVTPLEKSADYDEAHAGRDKLDRPER